MKLIIFLIPIVIFSCATQKKTDSKPSSSELKSHEMKSVSTQKKNKVKNPEKTNSIPMKPVVIKVNDQSKTGKITRPKPIKNHTTKCLKNSDCVFAYVNYCDRKCPPCGKVWRKASNKKFYNQIKMGWAIKVPQCDCNRKCKTKTIWLGTKTLCENAYCIVK
jgi:hypothetical protein